MSRASVLLLSLLALTSACAARQQEATHPPIAPVAAAPQQTDGEPDALTDVLPPPEPTPAVPWRARAAGAIADLQASDPALYEKLLTLRPNHRVGAEQFFTQPEIADPRAAPVLLKRLLGGDDPVATRLAVVDALPATGGDWQEGAAALVAIDASPKVRKKLVEVLRYVAPPHNLDGLRLALQDEDPAVRVAAARTTGFTRDGIGLYTELVSATFDEDWDMRAAAVQALGQLRVGPARGRLERMLTDERPEVRLQVLIALEHIDPEGVRELPALERLARDRDSRKVARLAMHLLREREQQARGEAAPQIASAGGASGSGVSAVAASVKAAP